MFGTDKGGTRSVYDGQKIFDYIDEPESLQGLQYAALPEPSLRRPEGPPIILDSLKWLFYDAFGVFTHDPDETNLP